MDCLIANSDNIESVQLHKQKEASFTYFEATPKKTIFFGLITTASAKPAGWGYHRQPLEFFNGHGFVNDGETLFDAPYIVITYRSRNTSYIYYKSDEEALEVFDELRRFKNKFIVFKDE